MAHRRLNELRPSLLQLVSEYAADEGGIEVSRTQVGFHVGGCSGLHKRNAVEVRPPIAAMPVWIAAHAGVTAIDPFDPLERPAACLRRAIDVVLIPTRLRRDDERVYVGEQVVHRSHRRL